MNDTYQTFMQGDRVFLHGVSGNGYVNFGKVVDGIQTMFFDDGRMIVPKDCPLSSPDAIADYCGFNFRDRHPYSLEMLDHE